MRHETCLMFQCEMFECVKKKSKYRTADKFYADCLRPATHVHFIAMKFACDVEGNARVMVVVINERALGLNTCGRRIPSLPFPVLDAFHSSHYRIFDVRRTSIGTTHGNPISLN